MTPSLSDKAEALTQAIEALSTLHPPERPSIVARAYRSQMVWAATKGKIDEVLRVTELAQLPKEQVTAIIALIYG